jgi:apolipoprotein N-acyltransferase
MWIGFYWLVNTMVEFGYIPLPLSLLFFGVIGLGNGVRLGCFAWWTRRATMHPAPWWYHLLLPACVYVAFDYLFPRVFPWYLGTLQWAAGPLAQSADITGVHGVTFLVVVCNLVLTAYTPQAPPALHQVRHRMGIALVLLLVVHVGYGLWRTRQVATAMAQAQTLRLGLIQSNIGINEKGSAGYRVQHLRKQFALSTATLAQQPDLVIWPETMYPYTVSTTAKRLGFPPLDAYPKTYWLLGALMRNRNSETRQVFNSALLMSPERRIVGRYDKQQLLAFGEYIPLQRYLPFLRNISPTIGNLTPGDGGVITLPNGAAFGPLICYEDILPTLSRKAVRQGAAFLVNLTNNAWFGRTSAPYQHRMLAAFRAIENRVTLVRATNTGLTSLIDPLGREIAPLPLYRDATLVQSIPLLRLATIYTRWGDWFAQLCSGAALLLPLGFWSGKRRQRRARRSRGGRRH